MSSNFTKIAPNIKKSFTSGTSFNQGAFPKSNLNNNAAFQFSTFTSNIGASNIAFPFNHNYQTPIVGDYGTSNLMIPSGEFNVLKVDISSQKTNDDTRLDIYYGHNQNLEDSTIKYSTIIEGGTNFYRNYPIENEYFSISLKNLDQTISESSIIDGRVTLSKYTQYNAPIQLSDEINRFTMGSIERQANNYNWDIINGRVSDVSKVERIGVMPTDYGNAEQIVWGINSFNTFKTALDFRPLVVRTEGGDNTNTEVVIEGIGIGNEYIKESVTLPSGSSNAFTINEYKFVGNMYFLNGGENGGLSVIAADRDTGVVYNYIEGDSTTSTSLLYTCPTDKTAIIKDINLSGRMNLVNRSHFDLTKVNYTSNSRTSIFQNRTIDDSLNTSVSLNYKLEAGDCLIGSMKDGNGSNTITEGDSALFSRLNIYEFTNSDSKIV